MCDTNYQQRFKQMRNKAGITPEKAACELGVSISTLFNWENERTYPNADKLVMMAELYGCKVNELLPRNK